MQRGSPVSGLHDGTSVGSPDVQTTPQGDQQQLAAEVKRLRHELQDKKRLLINSQQDVLKLGSQIKVRACWLAGSRGGGQKANSGGNVC